MKYQCGNGFFVYAHLESPSASDLATFSYAKSLGCGAGYGMNYAVGHN